MLPQRSKFGRTYRWDDKAAMGVYQWTVPIPKHDKDSTEWHRRPRAPDVPTLNEAKSSHHGHGARNLVDMTIKVVTENLGCLVVGDLDDVPFRIIRRVWDSLPDCRSPSLQSHIVLARCIAEKHGGEQSIPGGLSYLDFPVRPEYSLSFLNYIQPLMTSSFEFIVQLTLARDLHFSTSDYQSLTRLKNLGVLEIIQSRSCTRFPRITDSVVRNWSEVSNPFPILRVLRIWGDHFTTFRSLRYLPKFPSLAVYDVAGRAIDWDDHWEISEPEWHSDANVRSKEPNGFMLRHFFRRWSTSGSDLGNFIQDSLLYSSPRSSHEPAGIQTDVVDAAEKNSTWPEVSKKYGHLFSKISLHTMSYMLFRQIGRLLRDRDLAAQGMNDIKKLVEDDYRSLPTPYIAVNFCECKHTLQRTGFYIPDAKCPCRDDADAFETHYTFIRKIRSTGEHEQQSSSSHAPSGNANKPASGPKLRKKRKAFCLEDL
ncbi:hypothetical protein F5Y11DRAFT_294591 [Daldinia sp. FL1419]|nr:hypothetical protein F5Y11DRAFT_294591 [Daldinia sp. FL1419]